MASAPQPIGNPKGRPQPVSSPNRPQQASGAKGPFQYTGGIPPKGSDLQYLTFRGEGAGRRDWFSVMCGDEPPTVMGGYAKWTVIDRPLMTGVTVFQGYDPVKMRLALRFGAWDQDGWHINEDTGRWVEQQIEKLEWMAGAHFGVGQSPYVYVNSYGPNGDTTNLIPFEYQTTVGGPQDMRDTNLWPWIMADGIEWGKSYRARGPEGHRGGSRVYQECNITLTSFQGLTKPAQQQTRGQWYKVQQKARDNCYLIAEWPPFHALNVEQLARAIQSNARNNPLPHSKIKLKDHHLHWHIPLGNSVWVPAHAT